MAIVLLCPSCGYQCLVMVGNLLLAAFKVIISIVGHDPLTLLVCILLEQGIDSWEIGRQVLVFNHVVWQIGIVVCNYTFCLFWVWAPKEFLLRIVCRFIESLEAARVCILILLSPLSHSIEKLASNDLVHAYALGHAIRVNRFYVLCLLIFWFWVLWSHLIALNCDANQAAFVIQRYRWVWY